MFLPNSNMKGNDILRMYTTVVKLGLEIDRANAATSFDFSRVCLVYTWL